MSTTLPGRPRPGDVAAVAFVLVFLVLGAVVGYQRGKGIIDVDEAVYRHTLVAMQDGSGYYDAFGDALVAKEGVLPTSPHAYRVPTLYLGLSVLPAASWQLVAAIPFGAMLLAAWRLGRPYGEWGGAIAVVLVGFWVPAGWPMLYLHAEVWGAALLLAGLALVRERPRSAAAVLAMAVLVRELFALAFLFGWLRNRRSAIWWIAGAVVGSGLGAHLWIASGRLDPDGHQPALRFVGSYLEAVSPSSGVLGAAVGVVGGLLGLAGTVIAFRRQDPAARVVLGHSVLLALLTVTCGRTYWGYTWGPSTAVFAGALVEWVRERLQGTVEEQGEADRAPADAAPVALAADRA